MISKTSGNVRKNHQNTEKPFSASAAGPSENLAVSSLELKKEEFQKISNSARQPAWWGNEKGPSKLLPEVKMMSQMREEALKRAVERSNNKTQQIPPTPEEIEEFLDGLRSA